MEQLREDGRKSTLSREVSHCLFAFGHKQETEMLIKPGRMQNLYGL